MFTQQRAWVLLHICIKSKAWDFNLVRKFFLKRNFLQKTVETTTSRKSKGFNSSTVDKLKIEFELLTFRSTLTTNRIQVKSKWMYVPFVGKCFMLSVAYAQMWDTIILGTAVSLSFRWYRIKSVSFSSLPRYKFSKIAMANDSAAKTDSIEIDLMLILPFISLWFMLIFMPLSLSLTHSLTHSFALSPFVRTYIFRKIGERVNALALGRLCTHNFHPEKQSILQSKRVPWKIFYKVYYVCQGCVFTLCNFLSYSILAVRVGKAVRQARERAREPRI